MHIVTHITRYKLSVPLDRYYLIFAIIIVLNRLMYTLLLVSGGVSSLTPNTPLLTLSTRSDTLSDRLHILVAQTNS